MNLTGIQYVSNLPADAVFNRNGFYSPSNRTVYLNCANARSVFIASNQYLTPFNAVNAQLGAYGLGTVDERQKALAVLGFTSPKSVATVDPMVFIGVLRSWIIICLGVVASVVVLRSVVKKMFYLLFAVAK